MAKQKILAVDDEEDILELLRFNLTKEGFAVVCAGSGEEALKLTRLEKPELILLDLLLPGMDGLEVATQGPDRAGAGCAQEKNCCSGR
ncbi:MAG: drrA [Deltaproteobacteria bacterium]|nr:drrA [Deltaproteobacteria bacterium]